MTHDLTRSVVQTLRDRGELVAIGSGIWRSTASPVTSMSTGSGATAGGTTSSSCSARPCCASPRADLTDRPEVVLAAIRHATAA
jgi:hypothetical protein